MKTYTEMLKFQTFEERFRYLQLSGTVCKETFGRDRYINQLLYQKSRDWKDIRRRVIIRDNGCDLACEGFEINDKILIHHINPITVDDILENRPNVFSLNNLICTSHKTHNAIHYGNELLLLTTPIERSVNDTCPWKKGI